MNEGEFKIGLISAGLDEGIADMIAGVVTPQIEAIEGVIASMIEKNDAAALDSLFSAYERAHAISADLASDDNATDATKLRIAAIEDEILKRIAALAGIEEPDDVTMAERKN